MAKKNKSEKRDRPVIPSSIMGLDNIPQITRSVNRDILNENEDKVNEPEEIDNTSNPQTEAQTGLKGRPKKTKQEIVKPNKGTEWEVFLDYNSQYVTSGAGNDASMFIDGKIKKKFERLKLVLGEKAYLSSLVNAALLIFLENHKDKIVELITSRMMDDF